MQDKIINFSRMKFRIKRKKQVKRAKIRYDAISFALLMFFQSSMPLYSMGINNKPISITTLKSYYNSSVPSEKLKKGEELEKDDLQKSLESSKTTIKKLEKIDKKTYDKLLTKTHTKINKTEVGS